MCFGLLLAVLVVLNYILLICVFVIWYYMIIAGIAYGKLPVGFVLIMLLLCICHFKVDLR